MKEKLQVKDLINIGIFTAVYIVVMMGLVTMMGMVPILYMFAPIVVALVCGTVYMIFVMRTPKSGSVLIMSVLMSFVLLGAGWYAALWSILMGLGVELYLKKGGYKSLEKIKQSFLIFSLTTCGPYLGILLIKQHYIQTTLEYYGQAYADALDWLTPPWIILPLFVATLIAAYVGTRIGEGILSKHFKKAGII